MRLTKKKAIEISIELWTCLAETGVDDKGEWEGWEKYGEMDSDCALCECAGGVCSRCPYRKQFSHCCDYGTPFDRWDIARTIKERKKYALLFLEQLKELK